MSDRLRMQHPAFRDGLTREDLLAWFRAGRARTRALFDMVADHAYYERPILLRNPIVFYEGHLPAFTVNTLIRAGLQEPGVDAELEILFARGIDPESEDAARPPTDIWPSRERILEYGRAADALIEHALSEAAIDDPSRPMLAGGEAALTILEHEQMHQETLLYMFHNLPFEKKHRMSDSPPRSTAAPSLERIRIPSGKATLGGSPGSFGWDNEFPCFEVQVDAFEIDADDVTNGEYLEFVESTGAEAPHFWSRHDRGWCWRGMFEWIDLPLNAPVFVSLEQAAAYARWSGGRLATEAEYHRAAFGTPAGAERLYPWGDQLPDSSRGNFDFASWNPLPVGSFPAGTSAWGVRDLVGNGWEWTSSIFGGFPGFKPMPSYPQYSADFFDGAHYVLKGASPVTARHLVRRSFRNWFRPNYPHVYATFRCVR